MAHLADQLVGRTAELATLDEALAGLERARSGALELVGEPGMGKTRLLAELGARADGRGRSCSPAALRSWRATSRTGSSSTRSTSTSKGSSRGAWIRWATRSAPSSAPCFRRWTPDRRRSRAASATGPIAPFAALLETLAAAKPLVLLLDDVHWADASSVDLLGTLLRRPPAGVLVALAVRPRQVPERLSGSLERAQQAATLTRLDLAPLSAEEAGELLGADDAAALYGESGGNPFYLQQLARAPRRPGAADGAAGVSLAGVEVPRAVAAALTDELALLPADARRVLDGAAVAGDPFEPELAAAAAGVDEALATGALDELLRRDLVRATDVPRRFRFRHPLVRSAVYEAAPAGWRLGAHERSAALLAERGAPAAERAHHVERSARHGDLAAVAVLREAGEAAARRAPATAAHRFGAALRLLGPDAPERVPLLMAHAQSSLASGQLQDGYDATPRCLALLPADDVATFVRVTAASAALAHLLGLHDEAPRPAARRPGSPGGAVARGGGADDHARHRRPVPARLRGDARLVAARARGGARRRRPPRCSRAAPSLLALACVCDGDAEPRRRRATRPRRPWTGSATTSWPARSTPAARAWRPRSSTSAAARTPARTPSGRWPSARATGQRRAHPRAVLGRDGARGWRPAAGGGRDLRHRDRDLPRVGPGVGARPGTSQGRALAAVAAGDAATAHAAAEEAVELLRRARRGPAGHVGALRVRRRAGARRRRPRARRRCWSARPAALDLPNFPACWRGAGFELLTRCRLAAGDSDAAARAAAAAADAARGAAALPASRRNGPRRPSRWSAATRARRRRERLPAAALADEIGAAVEAAQARMLAGRALARGRRRRGRRRRAAARGRGVRRLRGATPARCRRARAAAARPSRPAPPHAPGHGRERRRGADRARARGRAAHRRPPDEPRDRRRAVPEPEDGRDPHPQPLPQARRLLAGRRRAGGRACRSRGGGCAGVAASVVLQLRALREGAECRN